MATSGAPWSRVRAIFEEALALPSAEREAHLRIACGSDADLRREIEELLRLEAETPELGVPVLEFGSPDARSPALERIGQHRIARLIGSGGMGEVYLAHREGPGFEQPVAIKLVKLGMDTREILSRFGRERAVLATLQHDGIARLLDAGATDDGRPYLVMEFVDGEPIDRYCTTHGLDVRTRIELFCEVCDAVQFAHQRLVLHRDLKPGNIFVTQAGRPKLLDFGLAKLIARDGETAEELTSAGERLFTPAYASPEQLRGEPVGISSDVFALGVVLYELLVGARPFASTRGFESSFEPVAERPSTRARLEGVLSGRLRRDARRRSSELSGDLDLILLKAIHSDIGQRYATVDAFARDLRRYLDGLPVEARPDSWGYRAARFAQRHRAATIASFVVLTALLASGGWAVRSYFSVVEARERADAQRELADQRRQQVEQREGELRHMAVRLMLDVHDSIAGLKGATGPREAVMKLSAEALQSVIAVDRASTEELFDAARAFVKLGGVQASDRGASRGERDDARESLCFAMELAERALQIEPRSAKAHQILGSAHDGLSGLALVVGNFDAAEWENVRAAIENRTASVLGASAPAAQEDFRELAQAGEIALQRHRFDDALRCFERIVALAAELVSDLGLCDALGSWARAEDDLARALRALQRQDEAFEHGELSLALLRQAVAISPENAHLANSFSQALERASRGRCERGAYDEAIELANENVDHMTRVAARDPNDAVAQSQLAASLMQQGLARYFKSDLNGAVESYERAIGMYRVQLIAEPTSAHLTRDFAVAQQYLGTAYFAIGKLDEGTRAFTDAIERVEAVGRRSSDAQTFEDDALGFRVNFVNALSFAAFDEQGEVRDAAAREACQRACTELLAAVDTAGGETRLTPAVRTALTDVRSTLAKCVAKATVNSQH